MTCMRVVWILMAAGLGLTWTTGCRPPAEPEQPEPPLLGQEPELDLERVSLEELRDRVRNLASLVRDFPGRTEEDHRALMRASFMELGGILPTLYGRPADGAFVQQMQILNSTQRQLDAAGPFLPTDATIATGLRATFNALLTISRRFEQEEAVQQGLRDLRERVAELDRVSGPIHRLVAGQAVQQATEVIQRMTSVLAQRAEQPDEEAPPQETPPPPPVDQAPPPVSQLRGVTRGET
jgi:hypothetical protein